MRPCASQAFDAARLKAFPPDAAWLTAAEDTLWGINMHLIDLRGVADVGSCVQCNCAYFARNNPTSGLGRDAAGQPLPGGGLQCCNNGCVRPACPCTRLCD